MLNNNYHRADPIGSNHIVFIQKTVKSKLVPRVALLEIFLQASILLLI